YRHYSVLFFLLNDTATPPIYTLSLHDALPISQMNPDLVIHSMKLMSLQIIVSLKTVLTLSKPAVQCSKQLKGERYQKSVITTTRSEEHTSELQSRENLVCRLLLEKKNNRVALE